MIYKPEEILSPEALLWWLTELQYDNEKKHEDCLKLIKERDKLILLEMSNKLLEIRNELWNLDSNNVSSIKILDKYINE